MTAASEGWADVMALSGPNRMEYALRWGMDFECRRHTLETIRVERQQFQMDALARTDWLWFQGADVIVTNMTVDPRAKVAAWAGYDFVIGIDCFGINNDSLWLQNTPAAMAFLAAVRDITQESDQWAMGNQMGLHGLRVLQLPQREVGNSYPEVDRYGRPNDPGRWQPGDWVAHYPAMCNVSRREVMTRDLGRVVR